MAATHGEAMPRIEIVSERLAQQPPELVRRLRQVYQLAPAEGARELAALVAETYDLVERALPQIDIARMRAIFHYQRPLWDDRPPA